MGNCQAAEAATVVIQHPTENGNGNGNGQGRVDRIYYSVSANEVMSSNPGYYVAVVLDSPAQPNGPPTRHQLKLLKPDDTLHIGRVYRLISFEGGLANPRSYCSNVLKEFTAKKSVKLGKLLKESGVIGDDRTHKMDDGCGSQLNTKIDEVVQRLGSGGPSINGGSGRGVGRHLVAGRGQWKPALQSIAESATS
ncbi:hypothetical protein Cgig2_009544 [Carnegiea gigantea]|uniref:Uncharacterized protein n=1 Tax=Carnegiea gigantea TaxID=171969 RepID=A0A9Q1KB58_9CARY|nr:hypothetical protein Cgig2_009544 [Carnegiea gigantea]